MSIPVDEELKLGTEKIPRTLYFIVIYNWLTRATRFFRNDDDVAWDLIKDPKNLAPEEHVYFASMNLPWTTGQGQVFEASSYVHREEWLTRRPLEADKSISSYLARAIFGDLHSLVPPHSFGPDIGPLNASCEDEDRGIMQFSLPTPKGRKHFRVAVVEICEEETK
jgi:hypothetical protein